MSEDTELAAAVRRAYDIVSKAIPDAGDIVIARMVGSVYQDIRVETQMTRGMKAAMDGLLNAADRVQYDKTGKNLVPPTIRVDTTKCQHVYVGSGECLVCGEPAPG